MKVQLHCNNPYIISIKEFLSKNESNEVISGLGEMLEHYVEYAKDGEAEYVKVMKK